MEYKNNLDDLCTKKIEVNSLEENGLADINSRHRLYDCSNCSGKPRSCPNYYSHEALLKNVGRR